MLVSDIYEVRIVAELPPQVAINVWHLQIKTVVGGGPTDQELATSIDTLLAATYKACLCDDAVYRGVGVKKVFPLPVGAETSATAGAAAGLNIGDILPKQIAAVISKITDLPGRRGRGRAYFPWPTEANNELTGTPTAAYRGLLAAYATNHVGVKTATGAGATSCTYQWGVFARSPGVANFGNMTSLIVRARWGTQRRRGDFGRSNTPPF